MDTKTNWYSANTLLLISITLKELEIASLHRKRELLE